MRDLAGISGHAMAKALGVRQTTIWRIDHGRQLPSMPRVRAWLDAAGVGEAERSRLLDLAEAVHGETRPWRDLLGDREHFQDVARGREKQATLIQNFQPTVAPGLLQTPEYARLVLGLGHTTDVDAAVAGRIQRQQILYAGTCRFEFAIAEPVLRADFGEPQVLAAQRDRIRSLAGLDSVRVLVVPHSAPLLAWHNFILWTDVDSDRFVTTELVHGAQELRDEQDVAVYATLWEHLLGVAVPLEEWG